MYEHVVDRTAYFNLFDFSNIDCLYRERFNRARQKRFLLQQFQKLFPGMTLFRSNDLDVDIAVRSHGFLRAGRDPDGVRNCCQVNENLYTLYFAIQWQSSKNNVRNKT